MKARLNGFEQLERRDVPATVTISTEMYTDQVLLNVYRDDPTGTLTVDLHYGGTAVYGVDYAALPTSYTFQDGVGAATLAFVEVLSDGVWTPDLYIDAAVVDNGTYTPGDPVTIPLTDPDPADPGPDDPARVEYTFDLDGVGGSFRGDVAWGQVDPDAEYQEVPLTDFQLTLGDRTFRDGDGGFSAGNPVAVFEDGEFQYIRFDATFDEPAEGLNRVTGGADEAGAAEVTGYTADGGEEKKAPAQDTKSPRLILDFANMQFPGPEREMRWQARWSTRNADGTYTAQFPMSEFVDIPPDGTPAQVRNAMYTVLTNMGLRVAKDGATGLEVMGPADKELGKLEIVPDATGRGLRGPSSIPLKGTGAAKPVFDFDPGR